MVIIFKLLLSLENIQPYWYNYAPTCWWNVLPAYSFLK